MIRRSLQNRKVLWGLFVALLLIIVLLRNQNEEIKVRKPRTPDSVDTYVPLGFQLIPIQIGNLQELSALIQDYALVDLYHPGKPDPVIQKVRMIRSPLNPDVFAVLVEHSRAAKVLSFTGDFWVTVRNPKHSTEKLAKSQSRRKIIQE